MANSAQARKRARQAEATRKRNASHKSELRSAVKKVKKAIEAGDKAVELMKDMAPGGFAEVDAKRLSHVMPPSDVKETPPGVMAHPC